MLNSRTPIAEHYTDHGVVARQIDLGDVRPPRDPTGPAVGIVHPVYLLDRVRHLHLFRPQQEELVIEVRRAEERQLEQDAVRTCLRRPLPQLPALATHELE